MTRIGEFVKSADWKSEKHVPVIDSPDSVKAGENFTIRATVGKEIAHPNNTEHHIRWIHLFFLPEGETSTVQLGSFDFSAHGESAQGTDQGPLCTEPDVQVTTKLKKSGILIATGYCNIHGLWESSREITVRG